MKGYRYLVLMIICPVMAYSDFSAVFLDYSQIPPFRELRDKIEIGKTILKEQCFDADAGTPFTSTSYSVASEDQRFVSSWGCTNTDGTLTDLVAVHATTIADIGFLSNRKLILVALDQEHSRIDSDAANIATRYVTAWCLKTVDTSGNAVSDDLDVDGDGENDRSISSILGYRECGTIS